MSTIKSWLREITANATNGAIADKIKISRSTLNRQISLGAVPAETIIEIARAYGANVIAGLVANGIITKDEAFQTTVIDTLRLSSDADLLNEVWRRLNAESGEHPLFATPLQPIDDVSAYVDDV